MGLAVLDARVLVLDSVVLVSAADTPGNALAVALWEDHAFVADKRQGMSIFRIDGGEAPVPVARMPWTAGAWTSPCGTISPSSPATTPACTSST